MVADSNRSICYPTLMHTTALVQEASVHQLPLWGLSWNGNFLWICACQYVDVEAKFRQNDLLSSLRRFWEVIWLPSCNVFEIWEYGREHPQKGWPELALPLADYQQFGKSAHSHRNPASKFRQMSNEILLLDRVRELPSYGSSSNPGGWSLIYDHQSPASA